MAFMLTTGFWPFLCRTNGFDRHREPARRAEIFPPSQQKCLNTVTLPVASLRTVMTSILYANSRLAAGDKGAGRAWYSCFSKASACSGETSGQPSASKTSNTWDTACVLIVSSFAGRHEVFASPGAEFLITGFGRTIFFIELTMPQAMSKERPPSSPPSSASVSFESDDDESQSAGVQSPLPAPSPAAYVRLPAAASSPLPPPVASAGSPSPSGVAGGGGH